jgi:hypothetical protein
MGCWLLELAGEPEDLICCNSNNVYHLARASSLDLTQAAQLICRPVGFTVPSRPRIAILLILRTLMIPLMTRPIPPSRYA